MYLSSKLLRWWEALNTLYSISQINVLCKQFSNFMNKSRLTKMERQGMQIPERPTKAMSSLSPLLCSFIMSTGSLSPHYMKWYMDFDLLVSSKNQHVLLISNYAIIYSSGYCFLFLRIRTDV